MAEHVIGRDVELAAAAEFLDAIPTGVVALALDFAVVRPNHCEALRLLPD